MACLAGVVLVSKPQFLFGGDDKESKDVSEWARLFAIFCALLGAVMSAIAYVTVRKIGKGAHFMVHVVYFGAISSAFSLVGMFAFQKPVAPHGMSEYNMLLLVGITAFIGQCFLNQG